MTVVPSMKSDFVRLIVTVIALAICGCRSQTKDVDKAPKLKTFLSKTDQLLEIQHLPSELVQLPAQEKDDSSDGVSSHWEPGHLELSPVIIEQIDKDHTKSRGARIKLDEHYYLISSKYTSPKEGKHDSQTAVLDDDELIDLLNAIDYIEKRSQDWRSKSPKFDTEVNFRSKDGFELLLGQDSEKKVGTVVKINDATEFLTDTQLGEFRGKLGRVIDALKQN